MKTQKDRKIYTPSEINYFAKQTLEQMTAWIEGEISTVQVKENWYYAYFTLKDDLDILPCFVEPARLKALENFSVGQKVMVYGVLTLFKKNEYKMRVYKIEESGDGSLDKKFKELYERLKNEGLFDEKHKKPLPQYPHRICLISSENSAGWNDFKKHTVDQFPALELITFNVKVEGAAAISELLSALSKADSQDFDLIVITRGGGSQESLDAVFNDEGVARAVYSLKTPSLAAVGHEINTTLVELAADVRASTPTDAAHITTSNWQKVLTKLNRFEDRLISIKHKIINVNYEKLDHSMYRLQNYNQNIIYLNQRLESLNQALAILSPQNTLNRGYSIVYNQKGKILKRAQDAIFDEVITVKLAKGQISSKVIEKNDSN